MKTRPSILKIHDAYLDCLNEYKVSVAAICKKAGINRSTFYDNFEDLNHLAASIEDEWEKKFAQLDLYVNVHNYIKLFEFIAQNQTLTKLYIKLELYKKHPTDYKKLCQVFHMEYDPSLEYRTEFFIGGIRSMIVKWLEDGCQLTPAHISNFIRDEYQGRLMDSKD